MDARRSQLSTGLLVMTGVLFGWILAVSRPTPIQASAGDRNEESVLATGPVMVRHDESSNAPIPLDALYFLDYKGGRLLATVPSYRQVGTKLQFIDGFAERDLLADFKLESGREPKFLMTTGSLGQHSLGWAPLYVFETTTRQVAVYRMQHTVAAGLSAPKFELLQIRNYPRAGGGLDPSQ